MPEPVPFSGRSGRGVTVAVIDSGVHPGHPHIIAEKLAGGACVLRDGTVLAGEEETRDALGHGTAVTAAIQETVPGARILTVRVFRDSLKTSAAALCAAIAWSVENGADIINLSLGSANAAHASVFSHAADKAAAEGALIVAAAEAQGQPCWPGCLPHVVGTGLDWDLPRGECRVSTDRRMIMASGYPRPIPGVEPRRNLYGVSFAVAQVTGLIALRAGGPLSRDSVFSLFEAAPA